MNQKERRRPLDRAVTGMVLFSPPVVAALLVMLLRAAYGEITLLHEVSVEVEKLQKATEKNRDRWEAVGARLEQHDTNFAVMQTKLDRLVEVYDIDLSHPYNSKIRPKH